jgi:acetate kinase
MLIIEDCNVPGESHMKHMSEGKRLATDDTRAALIPVAVSARHVHLCTQTIEALFGPHHALHARTSISQPDQYASEETVTLVGPKGRLEHVRVVGPARSQDQFEISRTDAIWLGLEAPVRESGDLRQTPGITIAGPKGSIVLQSGVICSLRHIHMSPADAVVLGLKDRDQIEVSVTGGGRRVTFGDVRVRVSPTFRLEFHIDTDEANAAGLQSHDTVQYTGRSPPA